MKDLTSVEVMDSAAVKPVGHSIKAIEKHGLPYEAKTLTPGDGNCFYWAIVDQVRQNPSIGSTLQNNEVLNWDHHQNEKWFISLKKSGKGSFDFNCLPSRGNSPRL